MATLEPPARCVPRAEERLSDRARARRRAILEAGRALSLERGYAETTLAGVVARSGGSLATVCALFGNRRGLFEAILRDQAAKVLAPLAVERVPPGPEQGLAAVGRCHADAALDPMLTAGWRALRSTSSCTAIRAPAPDRLGQRGGRHAGRPARRGS